MPLQRLYNRLFAHYGPQHWWPADTPFEVVVGAILTQNTNWLNVERAIANLRSANVLDPAAIRRLPTAKLEALIRPSGFFRQKADRLQQFTHFLHNSFRDDLQQLFALPLPDLRLLLLEQNGIGPLVRNAPRLRVTVRCIPVVVSAHWVTERGNTAMAQQ